jgi:hypothetical protein
MLKGEESYDVQVGFVFNITLLHNCGLSIFVNEHKLLGTRQVTVRSKRADAFLESSCARFKSLLVHQLSNVSCVSHPNHNVIDNMVK